ncbi:MAG: hypothetical protein KGL90_11475 [Burkholderiales bacterium]|nr:hypothetical protein [Burkholderiales bacterium]
MLDENLTSGFKINLTHASRQRIDMQIPDALREAFRAACLASCYFGGGLIKVRNWAPGLTLRVTLGEGPWLADLPNLDDAVYRLEIVADTFDQIWNMVDYDIRAWLSSPRQPPVHAVTGLGNTTVCWSERTACVEAPAMTWDACWPGLSPPQEDEWLRKILPPHDYRGYA